MVYYTYDEMDYIRNLCLVRLFFLHNCRLDILMLVNIKGSTKTTRKLVESAVWDYAERLMSKRLAKTLVLNINLIRNYNEKEGCEGSWIWAYWDELKKTPREFTIELDSSISIRNILLNLAHEMVHIKQWAKGEIYEYATPGKVRFMKKKYDMNDLEYWDYPWEVEAFGKQLGLFVRFFEKMGFGEREDMMEEA